MNTEQFLLNICVYVALSIFSLSEWYELENWGESWRVQGKRTEQIILLHYYIWDGARVIWKVFKLFMQLSSNDQSFILKWGVERQRNFECGLQHAFGIHTKMRIRNLKPLPKKLSAHDLTWPWKINALFLWDLWWKVYVAEIKKNTKNI